MFSFNGIIKKLKKHSGEKTDAGIARTLKVTPQALSGFKKNDKFPPELLIRYCAKNKLSTDWMFGIERPGRAAVTGFTMKLDEGLKSLKKAVLTKGGKKITEEKLALIVKYLKSKKEYRESHDVLVQLLSFLEFISA
ncbi:MAG: hypothetical protein A2008_03475 [Candidatus Wallbacteria bacterium GWC2_49_35]|uniref:Uncharacterized protein n=1 Tax=Candidatus Wallbacteria bacterium GWC2_49_35 TaxID=1817813 RepID=A0A1F7WZA4_9BACT|nr:MAG: hypothetical protein A2008_03475 [Candidatus Wallbacteria bacterium GWC2_49_35]HBC74594.1 hypothetical protein [Candidatus Wallbacteria bacterium]